MAVLGPNKPHGLCGREAILNFSQLLLPPASEQISCRPQKYFMIALAARARTHARTCMHAHTCGPRCTHARIHVQVYTMEVEARS